MEIQFSENTKIIADDRNYIVQKRNKCVADSELTGTKKGEWGAWRDNAYYQNWGHLIGDMLDLKIRQKEVVFLISEFKTSKTLTKMPNNKY